MIACCVMQGQGFPKIQIIDRQLTETEAVKTTPATATAKTTGNNPLCQVAVVCQPTATTTATVTPATVTRNPIQGAKLTLQLPDGRRVVVGCVSKGSGNYIRSCRIPLVDEIAAEFKGKDAKLKWIVSIDGKKTESETYTILSVSAK